MELRFFSSTLNLDTEYFSLITYSGFMKIIYIPLDDRPCNVYYPQWIARLQPAIELLVPPIEILGRKKQPAIVEELWHWLAEVICPDTIVILSIEMLVYGGLVPSRLHYLPLSILHDRLDHIRQLFFRYPTIKIFASNLIMRCPTYNSSEEEPDYYEQWGADLFRWGWLKDRGQRSLLTEGERLEQEVLNTRLPASILQDYCDRREKNLSINQAVIELVHQGVIHFLSIPQDDAAPYGFTAMDQSLILAKIKNDRLGDSIHLYPGADEVGCTLLARAYLRSHSKSSMLKFYPLYANPQAESLIPRYEDRPLRQSIDAHIRAVGGELVSDSEAADIILALNTPGSIMQESWEQDQKDSTYSTQRNLSDFVTQIKDFITQEKTIAFADIAFSNGGETECIQWLDRAGILDRLLAYGGWNTCCNTLGTVLATATLGWRSDQKAEIAFNLIYHLLEDWLYQAIVRQELVQHYLPVLGVSYYDFGDQKETIATETERRLQQYWQTLIQNSFGAWHISHLQIYHPWERMFEIGMDLELRLS